MSNLRYSRRILHVISSSKKCYPSEYEGILYGILHLFCRGSFVLGESDLFFAICSSVPFAARSPVSADSPGKFCLLFHRLGILFLRMLEHSLEYLMFILKQKLGLLGKKKCSYKNNRKLTYPV